MKTLKSGNMNIIEKLVVNNYIRKLINKYWELPTLKSLGMDVAGKLVLDVGCGVGYTIKELTENYQPKKVVGIDVDESSIRIAKRNNPDCLFQNVSINHNEFFTDTFDCVISIATLHHIENWKTAVNEISRILRVNGQFLLIDFTKQGLDRWFYRLFDHPRKNMFTGQQLLDSLFLNGIKIEKYRYYFFGDIIFIVGRKISA